jgi:FixJ family two-component response regulator
MFTVFVVDDDPGVLKAMSRLLRSRDYAVRAYASPQDFLAHHDAAVPGCALLDVSMPELNGLELQKALTEGGSNRPVIFVTGKGDIPISVRAMKAGALDFLTKPVSGDELLAAIARAEEQDIKSRAIRTELASIEARLATLTPRERQVIIHVVAGRLNKQTAAALGITEKTTKVHRGRAMQKMGAHSTAELARMLQKVGI